MRSFGLPLRLPRFAVHHRPISGSPTMTRNLPIDHREMMAKSLRNHAIRLLRHNSSRYLFALFNAQHNTSRQRVLPRSLDRPVIISRRRIDPLKVPSLCRPHGQGVSGHAFSCSTRTPQTGLTHLHVGHRLASKRTPARLIPKLSPRPGFDVIS